VKHVIHLGDDTTPPHFGHGSPGSRGTPSEDSQMGKTIVIAGFPIHYSDNQLQSMLSDLGFPPYRTEVMLNPDKKPRTCGIAEYSTKEEAWNVVEKLSHPKIYARHLSNMVFPGTVGDCCSFKAVNQKH